MFLLMFKYIILYKSYCVRSSSTNNSSLITAIDSSFILINKRKDATQRVFWVY